MDASASAWLQSFLRSHGAVAGTVHWRVDDTLELAAAVNIPPKVLAAVQNIARGKGMAGLAFEREAPVTTCNLGTDETGDVRPGAKAVDAQAAAAIPVHDGGGAIRAVVGLAFADERELSEADLTRYAESAATLPGRGAS